MALSSTASGVPMGEINTTPLVDVMLVLLIMFVVTIPAATHETSMDLPQDCPSCPLPPLTQDSNRVTIDIDDRLRWNGAIITQDQLANLLYRSRLLPIEPELQFEPAAQASYDVSARTLRIIERSGVTRFGFVGNERYRNF